MNLREDASYIVKKSIEYVLPDEAVRKALENKVFDDGEWTKCHLVIHLRLVSYKTWTSSSF